MVDKNDQENSFINSLFKGHPKQTSITERERERERERAGRGGGRERGRGGCFRKLLYWSELCVAANDCVGELYVVANDCVEECYML